MTKVPVQLKTCLSQPIRLCCWKSLGYYTSWVVRVPRESPRYSERISPSQCSVYFLASAESVPSYKSLRSQQNQLLPVSGLKTPEICLRNTVAQGGFCGPPPKLLLGCTSCMRATEAKGNCLLSNSWPKESTGVRLGFLGMGLLWVI